MYLVTQVLFFSFKVAGYEGEGGVNLRRRLSWTVPLLCFHLDCLYPPLLLRHHCHVIVNEGCLEDVNLAFSLAFILSGKRTVRTRKPVLLFCLFFIIGNESSQLWAFMCTLYLWLHVKGELTYPTYVNMSDQKVSTVSLTQLQERERVRERLQTIASLYIVGSGRT